MSPIDHFIDELWYNRGNETVCFTINDTREFRVKQES